MISVASRTGLLRKYLSVIVALVGGSLVLSTASQLYASYEQSRDAVQQVQLRDAATAAVKIGAFVHETETQLRWVTAPVGLGDISIAERRSTYERLLAIEPWITDLSYLDAGGRERLRLSRLALTVVDSGVDLSRAPKFVEARRGSTYFSPVYSGDASEPYLTVALGEPAGGVVSAEVNLKFVREVILPIKVGATGHAYVVDGAGQLVAHPDVSLVLRRTDLSGLSQVRAATARGAAARSAVIASDLAGSAVVTAYERVEATGWMVFVEQPLDEAFAPVYAGMWRSVLLLAVFLVVAALAAVLLARSMVRPIRVLEASVRRIGAGALDEHIDLRTGDELEGLAMEFDRMAARLRDSYATLELRVTDRTRQLADANERLREATLAKSRFLANMSHELRTPLNSIIGFSELLLQRLPGDLGRKQEEYVRDIADSGRHQLGLVNDILDLSKVEAGRMTLERSSFPIEQLVTSAVALVRAQAVRRSIEVDVSMDPQVETIFADERKVKQILVNLLSNAVKFTPDRGRIVVSVQRGDQAVEIAVADAGKGIAAADLARIFEEFEQARQGGFADEGTGLGLTLAKRLAELHGGRIVVESEPDRGSTFTFTLPLTYAPETATDAVADRSS